MKDSAGSIIEPGDVLTSRARRIYMMSMSHGGTRGMFRYMGRDQGAGEKFPLSQELMDGSKWVKVG